MAQACQNPAFDHEHAVLDLGLVLRAARTCRQHRHAIVLGQILIGRVDVRLVARNLGHPAAQVVGHPQFGGAAEEFQRSYMAADPVRQLLRPGRLDVGVVRCAQYGHEDLRLPDFTTVHFADLDCRPGVVDEQPLARRVRLTHRQRQVLAPAPVMLAEGTVLEAVSLLGLIFLPQQVKGDALAAQASVNLCPVWCGTLHHRRFVRWKQPAFQRHLIHVGRQGVGKARQFGARQVVCDGGRRNADDAGNFPLGAAVLKVQP